MDRLLALFDFNPVSTAKEPSVNAILKERIGERVSALQISWRRASLEAGLEQGSFKMSSRVALSIQERMPWRALLQCSSAALRISRAKVTKLPEQQGLTAPHDSPRTRSNALMR